MQRTDEKTKGLWGLVGGLARNTESAFEGLKREIQEEVGDTPKFKKIIPLEMFTSNDQKFFFHTYLIAVESEFIPKLNEEHSDKEASFQDQFNRLTDREKKEWSFYDN